MARAEKLKIEEGSCILGNCLPGEMILLKDDSGFAGKEIERETLNTIIHLHVREGFELLKRRLDEGPYLSYLGAGIFITGGCSLLGGIDHLAEEIFEIPAHLAHAQTTWGVTSAVEDPRFSTASGLVTLASVVAINTDVQSLTSSVAAHKVQLGRTMTRGLGTGGDPELGYDAAVESVDEIREALADARMIFVCAGLGGGTGSGAAPYVAQLAREAGALVIAFVTLPFTFEGKRRNAQAREALARLTEVAHSVICFENDRMGDIVAPHAGIHQAFAMADTTISQSVRSIVQLIQRPGLIRAGFDDLLAALRPRNGRCLFGFGESDSDNRRHD